MNIVKQIKLLVLVLAPAYLIGMEQDFGSWTTIDKKGSPVVLEWHRAVEGQINLEDAGLVLSQILPVMAEAFADKALLFLEEVEENYQVKQEYAATVKDLYDSRPGELESLIEVANKYKNDRNKRVELALQSFKQGIESQSPKSETSHQCSQKDFPDQTFVVMAKTQTGDVLGYAIFRVKAEFEKDNVELDELAVSPSAQGRGLARFLTSSILKLVPTTKRLFLGALIWNKPAQEAYKALGFNVYEQERYAINFEIQGEMLELMKSAITF